MAIRTVKWVGGVDGYLELIDQRLLPGKFTILKCRNIEQVYDAIKTLAVRGAPAIGVAAAYGLVLGMQKLRSGSNLEEALKISSQNSNYLGSSRPTAVNLFWAMERVKKAVKEQAAKTDADLQTIRELVLSEANSICNEDIEMCRKIGARGEKFIKEGAGILTHCNAGALATAGEGTALSVLFAAQRKGKKFKAYVDETRPLLQGARLTAWELKQADIDVTLLCDNMAGWLMKQGRIDVVITGADRIASNGDAANKIGTYSLSILAAKHNIPFYIAAPTSTFDLNIKSGDEIPIEQRPAEEVTEFGGMRVAAEGVNVYNPAFDVTSASLITAFITEKVVIERPNKESISKCLGK